MPDAGRRTTLVATLEDAPCQTRVDAPLRSQRWRTRHARRGQTHRIGRNAERTHHARRRKTHHVGRNAGGRAMPDAGRCTTLVAALEDVPRETRAVAPRRSQRWRTRHARHRQTHHAGRNAGGRAMPDAGKRTTSVATLEDAPCQTQGDAPHRSQRWRTRDARHEKAHHVGRNAGGCAMPDAGRRTSLVATLEDAPCQTREDAPRWSQR